MNKLGKTVGVTLSALTLTLAAGFTASASAETVERATQAPTQQQDLDWWLVSIYPTYDACYWAGFDGWNNFLWDHWRCPETFGAYWLMVAND